MPVTNSKADWVGGDLVFSEKSSGDTILTIGTDGLTLAQALILSSYDATATSDGLTTGTLPAGVGFVTVTSASANNIIVLPDPVVGQIIILKVGANGYELRSSAPATISINGGTGASAESAIAANAMVIAVCTSATSWQAISLTAATLAAVEAAA